MICRLAIAFFSRQKHGMTQKLQRLFLFAALAIEGASPARAAPPEAVAPPDAAGPAPGGDAPATPPAQAAAPKKPSRPRLAALPKNPPLPPERPAFPDDPPAMPADPATLQSADPASVTPQGVYQEAALDGSSSVSQYAPTPAQTASSWPFGGLIVPAPPPAPPPVALAPEMAEQPAAAERERGQSLQGLRPSSVEVPRPLAEAAYDRVPPREAGPYEPRPANGEAVPGFDIAEKAGLADMTRKYAQRNGIPLALLHRVIMRESKYCPRLINHRYYGLMQITPATARSMGYHGSAKGLLDPETNLAYASAYLANAWALADGDMDRAVRLYASGYYYTAKSKHMLDQMRDAKSPPVATLAAVTPPPEPPPPPSNIFEAMFGGASR